MSKKLKPGISFLIEPVGKLFIPLNIVNQLQGYRQCKHANTEAGGIFLGTRFKNKHVVVSEITTPLKMDKRTRYGYYRSKGHHDFAVKRWKQSDGICLYLGLWHTHPESNPTPSSVDYHDWTNAMRNGRFEGDNLFFVIVGTRQICCWQGMHSGILRRTTRINNEFKKLRVLHD